MLIQVLLDDLMRSPKGCIQRWGGWTHWRVFGFCQRGCTWRWDDQMHWRICDVLPESCTWHWNNQMHWRFLNFRRRLGVFLAVSTTGVMARFWLMWRRQTNRQTKRQEFVADCKICRLKLAEQNLTEMTQAGKQINMLTGRRNVRNLYADCKICRLNFSTAMRNLTDWRKQTGQARRFGFADNAAKQKNKNPQLDRCLCESRVKKLIWWMLIAEQKQNIDSYKN